MSTETMTGFFLGAFAAFSWAAGDVASTAKASRAADTLYRVLFIRRSP
jgi:hypothetical protein